MGDPPPSKEATKTEPLRRQESPSPVPYCAAFATAVGGWREIESGRAHVCLVRSSNLDGCAAERLGEVGGGGEQVFAWFSCLGSCGDRLISTYSESPFALPLS